MTDRRVDAVLVGGPGSGKTSYLGALWSTVKNALPHEVPRLSGDMPPRTGYLIAAEDALLGGQSVGRTNRDTGERVKLDVVLDAGSVSVRYTDLAGETLTSVLLERKAPEDLVADLSDANALMLFIHPNDVRAAPTIAEGARLAKRLGEEVADNPLVESGDVAIVADGRIWAEASSAVHLVELLQVCLEFAEAGGYSIPIAVVVSAWDRLEPAGAWGHLRPSSWLSAELPLLAQFLESNCARHPWKVFGVSAQGFDFDDTPDDAEVWDLRCSERTVVVTDDGWSHEITGPISWLLQATGEG